MAHLVMNKRHLSYLSPTTEQIFDLYSVNIPSGKFTGKRLNHKNTRYYTLCHFNVGHPHSR